MRRVEKSPRLTSLAAAAVVVAALKLGAELILPFAVAFVLTFVLAPLVARLEKLRLPHVVAVLLAALLAFAAGAGLVWLLFGQLAVVVDELPAHGARLAERVAGLRGVLGDRIEQASTAVREMGERLSPASRAAGSGAFLVDVAEKSPLFGWLGRGMGALAGALGAIGVVAVLTTIMLLKREDFRERFVGLVGGSNVYVLTKAMDEATRKVSRYLLIYTLLNGLHGVAVGVGLWLIGVPNAPLWGLLSALLRFVPYLGPWIAAAFPILIACADSTGWGVPAATLGLFLTLELVSNNVLEPLLYGSGTGVSPAAILMAVVFWTWLWGIVGLVVATPLTVVLAVMGKYVPGMGLFSVLLSERPVTGDGARLYQRLLAGDQDGASEILEPLLAERPLAAAYDDVLMPALILAAEDRRRSNADDALDEAFVRTVRETIDDVALRSARRKSDAALAATTPPDPAEPPAALRAYCLPARDALDEAAGALFAQVAAEAGVVVEVATSDALSSARAASASASGADAILVSALPPSPSWRRPRYFVERLRLRSPGVPIVLCLWGETATDDELRARIGVGDDVATARTLAEALERVADVRAARDGARGAQTPSIA
jgi:predicted PurR-regulated permease PerM